MPASPDDGRRQFAWREIDRGLPDADPGDSHGPEARPEKTPERPTVFVVDDDAETREVLRTLADSAGFAAEFYGDARTFLKALEPARTGCVVLDVRLQDMTSLEVQKELAKRKISIPVIVTTGYADLKVAIEAMRAGAFDVLEKPFVDLRLVESIRQAIAQYRNRHTQQAECDEVRRRYASLTPRERQVLELVVAGMTSKRIAAELGLQEKTIEVYRSRINGTMKARNAAHLVRLMALIY